MNRGSHREPPRPFPDPQDPYIGAPGTNFDHLLAESNITQVLVDAEFLQDHLTGVILHYMGTASTPQWSLYDPVKLAVRELSWTDLRYWLDRINTLGKPAIKACRLILVGR